MFDAAQLLAAARAVAARAYAPYSGFAVGAAVTDGAGRIWSGCNIENASYGLSICAERSAAAAAVAAGAGRLLAVAVASPQARPCLPCGACRQVLLELGGPSCAVVLEDADGGVLCLTLEELLPRPFRRGGAPA